MFSYSDVEREVDLRIQEIKRVRQPYRIGSPMSRRVSLPVLLRAGLARLGDLLITVGCELEIRYLTEGQATPCAG